MNRQSRRDHTFPFTSVSSSELTGSVHRELRLVMDVDFWSSRVHSDGDEYTRTFFPCPFCYVEIKIQRLCSHLQDEHCFNLKNAVCPLCAASLGKDVTRHFIVQHTNSLKHRRKSLKSGLLTENSGMLCKEMSSFLGSFGTDRTDIGVAEPDQVMSPFARSVSHSHSTGSRQDESFLTATSTSKSEISSLDGGNELDSTKRRQRAAFVQELVVSSIF